MRRHSCFARSAGGMDFPATAKAGSRERPINYQTIADNLQENSPVSNFGENQDDETTTLLQRRPRERLRTTAVAACIAAVPSLMVGYTLAFPSSALLDLTSTNSDLPASYRFHDTLVEVFAALAPVGGIIGGLISGPVADTLGRKDALFLCGVPYIIGYLTLAYAHYMPTALGFKALALSGRFLTGVGMGWACMAGSVYIGEISSAKFRGVFGSFIEIALALGVLISFAVGSIPHFRYYNSSLVAAAIVAIFEALMVTLYETPRWLVSKGRITEAYRSLRWLRGPAVDIESELKSNQSTKTAAATNVFASLKDFTKRSVAVPLTLVILVMFLQQAGGINALGSFSASMFEQAGVKNPRAAATYAVGGAELVATLVAVYLIDLLGRKILLVVSGVGMVVGSLLLGVDFYLTRPSLCTGSNSNNTLFAASEILKGSSSTPCNTHYSPLAIVSIVIFGAAFSVGWGPIPWILVSELSPLRVRGVMSGIATLVNWGTAAAVVGSYASYSNAVGVWFAWWSFTLLNIAAVVFTVFFLRETKGKSLEDIENYYQNNKL